MRQKGFEPPEPVAEYERDLVWASPGGDDIYADVSRPQGEGPFPILVWFHGGAWKEGRKEHYKGLACYITNRGYAVVNTNFRLSPHVSMKQMVEDAMGSIIWTKDNAEQFKGDPNRIAAAGHSSGGQLAAMAALGCGDAYFTPTYQSVSGHDSSVKCLLALSGVFDFESIMNTHRKWLTSIFGVSPDDDPEMYRRCSPMTYVKADLPPQLIVWGGKERLQVASEEWVDKLRDVGARVELYIQSGARHNWPTQHWKTPAKETYDRIIEFMDRYMKR